MSAYLEPGFRAQMPEVDATKPNDAKQKTLKGKDGDLGYHKRTAPEALDRIDEASLESFPSSDPPGWSGSIANPSKKK